MVEVSVPNEIRRTPFDGETALLSLHSTRFGLRLGSFSLRRWILLTRDAHGLYSRFGFTLVEAPERYMELHRTDVYEIRKTT